MSQQSLDSMNGTANMFYLNTLAPLNTNMIVTLIIDQHAQVAVRCCCLCDEAWRYRNFPIKLNSLFRSLHFEAGGRFLPITYLMKINSVTYVEKNHINCEWLDGIPNSVPIWTRLTGLGSLIQYFNIILLTSFTNVPIKNAIWKWAKESISKSCLDAVPWGVCRNNISKMLLTVCKSLRNRISVTKPAPIPIGAKLTHANNWPNRSPENHPKYLVI